MTKVEKSDKKVTKKQHKQSLNFRNFLEIKTLEKYLAVLPGLEPGNAAPKTVVLPLHYRTVVTAVLRLQR